MWEGLNSHERERSFVKGGEWKGQGVWEKDWSKQGKQRLGNYGLKEVNREASQWSISVNSKEQRDWRICKFLKA